MDKPSTKTVWSAFIVGATPDMVAFEKAIDRLMILSYDRQTATVSMAVARSDLLTLIRSVIADKEELIQRAIQINHELQAERDRLKCGKEREQ